MNYCLLWKEYRETRGTTSIMIITIALFFLLSRAFANDVALAIFDTIFIATAVLYSMALGATAFASERQSGQLQFLLKQPVPKARIWYSKCIFRGANVIAVITVVGLTATHQNNALMSIVVTFILAIFALSFLFSTVLDRPVTAGAAGLVFCGCAMYLLAAFVAKSILPLVCIVLMTLSLIISFEVFISRKNLFS